MDFVINMTIGEKIKFYRNKKKMTQKDLAAKCGVVESAIRNYELGIRTPDQEKLERIADALGINYYAIAPVDLTTPEGAFNALIHIEQAYDAKPEIINNKVVFSFKEGTILEHSMLYWEEIYRKKSSGDITEEEYFNSCLKLINTSFSKEKRPLNRREINLTNNKK